jgi:hypothetical protein
MRRRTTFVQVIEVNWDHDPASVLDISDADDPLEVTFRSVFFLGKSPFFYPLTHAKRPTTAFKEIKRPYERV